MQTETRLQVAGKEFRRAPATAQFGLLVIIVYILVAIFAPWIAPYGETEVIAGQYEPWSAAHPLGTDDLGRDLFSRLVYAARNTVALAFITTCLSFMLGSITGLLAAVVGRWVDVGLSRSVDVLLAIPYLIFALLLLTILGQSYLNLILVVALIDSTRVFRLSRAVGMNVVVMEFVEAARLRGEGLWWIIRHEVLPNIMAPLAAEFGLRFCFVFLTIAALSFLGLGIQPPTADWGSMLRETATLISFAQYDIAAGVTPLLPAMAIALLTVAVNFVVDWMLQKTSGLKD